MLANDATDEVANAMTFQFDQDTRIEAIGDGRYRGVMTDGWNIGDNPNGGFLLSIISAAFSGEVSHPDPISFTTHYLRPGLSGQPFEVDVEVLRVGRSLTTARAMLIQDGSVRLVSMAAYSDLMQSAGVDADISIAPIEIPPPKDCVSRTGDIQGIDIPMMSKLDVRLNPQQMNAGPHQVPKLSGWIRHKDHRPVDVRSLLLFSDTFPPSTFVKLGNVGWVPTIELTIHVRRRPADGWVLAEFQTSDLSEGRMIETGCLWDSNGQLVAQSRQVGLVMSRDG